MARRRGAVLCQHFDGEGEGVLFGPVVKRASVEGRANFSSMLCIVTLVRCVRSMPQGETSVRVAISRTPLLMKGMHHLRVAVALFEI